MNIHLFIWLLSHTIHWFIWFC